MDKNIFIGNINDAKGVLQEIVPDNTKLIEDFGYLSEEIENFKAKILMVGSFSAGKTALINTLLGDEEILKEDISPETAIATEVVYGSAEKVIRVGKDGSQSVCKLEEIGNLQSSDCSKYICILNNNVLARLGDKILVDMPGFDSGLEAHNKAILQYVGEAAAYIFVVDVSKGTLGKSSLNFLQEIRQYSPTIRFLLSKCDKQEKNNIEAVANNIEKVASEVMGYNVSVLKTSMHWPDTSERFEKLLTDIPYNGLLIQKIGPKAIELLELGKQALTLKLSALDYNPYELDREIREQEKVLANYRQELEKKRNQISHELHNQQANSIMVDIESALKNEKRKLIIAAESGGQAFSEEVNNILRRVFMESLNRHLDNMYTDLVESLEEAFHKNNIDWENATTTMRNTLSAVQGIVESGKKFAKMQKLKTVYKGLTTVGAVATSVVAPWLELVIIFLPEIISFLQNTFGENREEKLSRQIEQQVIPQICSRLQPQIHDSLVEVEQEMLADIEAKYNTIIENNCDTLEGLKRAKESNSQDIVQQKVQIESAINIIDNIEKSIRDTIQTV